MSQDSKNRTTGNWKYTSLSSSDINTEIQTSNNSETSPLLQNMENEEFARSASGNAPHQSSFVKIQRGSHMTSSDLNEKDKSDGSVKKMNETGKNNTADVGNGSLSESAIQREENKSSDALENSGARPKTKMTENSKVPANYGKPNKREGNLDIVRKMSDLSLDIGTEWKCVGLYGTLKSKRCQRLYAKTGRADDLALFHINGKFYAMEAWCTHMGGPLFDGDIESYNGRCHVMCPWHSYMFDLETGNNEIGLQDISAYLQNGCLLTFEKDVTLHKVRRALESSELPT